MKIKIIYYNFHNDLSYNFRLERAIETFIGFDNIQTNFLKNIKNRQGILIDDDNISICEYMYSSDSLSFSSDCFITLCDLLKNCDFNTYIIEHDGNINEILENFNLIKINKTISYQFPNYYFLIIKNNAYAIYKKQCDCIFNFKHISYDIFIRNLKLKNFL